MQTKRNPEMLAKGETQLEFCDRMKDMDATVTEYLSTAPREGRNKTAPTALYVFDHGRFHECPATLEEVAGIRPEQRAPQPAWGPDFNQPAEHAHGRFKAAMQRQLNESWWPESMAQLWERCQQVWLEVNLPEVVAKDVARLRRLYHHVKNVSMGNWAPKAYS